MIKFPKGRTVKVTCAATLAVGAVVATALAVPAAMASPAVNNSSKTSTPIKHVVVIFDENESFDHYFATYPYATNTDGTKFKAAPGTPKVNNLVTAGILAPNGTVKKSTGNVYDPQRLDPETAKVTGSNNHAYLPEQEAEDNGKMDQFVQYTSNNNALNTNGTFGAPGLGMDYYDGNTVTGLWNYAQNYSMSDNSWDVQFGPSSPGAINVISGSTAKATAYNKTGRNELTPTTSSNVQKGSLIGDADPAYDDCAATSGVAGLTGKNIGDVLNEKNITWGWFQGGFTPTTPAGSGATDYAKCGATQQNAIGLTETSYSPHHDPFQYYKSTSNPKHLPPKNEAEIGHNGQANHQYDTTTFDSLFQKGSTGTLPAVSFVKPPAAQDAHPGNSGPIDEQAFITKEINQIEQSKYWSSTAVVISYDDSDGWYDHVAPTIKNSASDTANNSAICLNAASAGVEQLAGDDDRCGPSQRLPLLVISPYSRQNYVAHNETDQTSVLKFIEQNWGTTSTGKDSFTNEAGSIDNMFNFARPQQREVLLSTTTGAVTKTVPTHVSPVKPIPHKPLPHKPVPHKPAPHKVTPSKGHHI
ncbi:phospholipase C [Gryllotalpicola reticulitermitis]|uniref:Phospholipase C n=1 Tax=Gryllotalpicola reticulitermitis TaxID=1184153 RepID=A0ABV8Q715_9MICO